jgi:hypothetical protein
MFVFRTRISSFKFQISNSNFKIQISNFTFQISNPESEIRNPKSEIRNPKSQISNLKSQISNRIVTIHVYENSAAYFLFSSARQIALLWQKSLVELWAASEKNNRTVAARSLALHFDRNNVAALSMNNQFVPAGKSDRD